MTLSNLKIAGSSDESFNSPVNQITSPPPQNQPHRPTPQPRYLRDPTTMESISSAFTGISSYVRKSIPDSLLTKAFQLKTPSHPQTPSPSSSFPPSPGGGPLRSQSSGLKPRSRVTFASFDYLRESRSRRRKLCLLLGYADGFHVWEVDDVGKINELALVKADLGDIKSLKIINTELGETGSPRVLVGSTRVLPTMPDEFMDTPRQEEFALLTLYSLESHSQVAQRVFENESITEIGSNYKCVVVATTLPSIRVLSRTDLKDHWLFSDVLLNPNTRQPVFALGPRWIAYSTTSETPWKASISETPGIGKNVKVDRVAKDVVNGLKFIGDYGYQQINNYLKPNAELSTSPHRRGHTESSSDGPSSPEERGFPKNSGRVVVRDLDLFLVKGTSGPVTPVSEAGASMANVAHFHCHYYPISNLSFNDAGNLLATSSVEGHTFYIFEINQRQPPLPPFRTLYKLSRGFTDARVVDMTFNGDSRWLATTTQHGTTHLFLINPYGGTPHAASHLEARVINGIPATHTTSLAPAVRFRRKQPDASEDVETDLVREDSVCAVHFLPSSHSLGRWLSKLPLSYDLPPAAARASNIMLTVDSEGVLKLLRINVSKKLPNPSTSAAQDLTLSTQVDSIAEWILAKLPSDIEKRLLVANDEPKSVMNSPQWEPESAWLPYVETRTYDPFVCPSRPLWTLRQFGFKEYCEDGNEDRVLGSECFTKDQRKTRVLAVRQQNMPHAQGISARNGYDLQPASSYGDIEGHLVHAMETKLDKPAMPKRLPRKQEAWSFEDALEIHMVHPMRQVSEKPTMTEIPLSYAEEETAYYQQSTHDLSSDQLGVFTMDELDELEYEASIESDPVMLHPVEHSSINSNSRSNSDGCPQLDSPDPAKFSLDSFLALTSSTEDI